MKANDLTGKRFGRLVVICRYGTYRHPYHKTWTHPTWLCICDCGTETIANGQDLKSGATRSCGCLRRETAALHGRAKKGRPRTGKLPVIDYSGVV